MERIRAVDVSRSIGMTSKAALVDHFRRGIFCQKVKDEFLSLRIFGIRPFRLQFCFGVSFAGAMTTIATGCGAILQCGTGHFVIRARVNGFGHAFSRRLMAASAC